MLQYAQAYSRITYGLHLHISQEMHSFERIEPTQVLESDQSSNQASSCDKTIIILTNTTNKSNYAV